MNIFGVMDVSGSALKAERVRAEVVASNMANSETTRTPEGRPYRRYLRVVSAVEGNRCGASLMSQVSPGQSTAPGGVAVTGVIEDEGAPLMRFDPQHPDADANG